MTLSKEILLQFVDGELAPQDASRIAAEIENDAQARAFVETQSALRQQFQAAFSPMLDDPVPGKLLSAVADTPVSWRWRMAQGLSRRTVWLWAGLPAAGALALGVAIGIAVNPSTVGPIGNENGTLVAQGALAHALDTQLASAAPAATGPQIGITFRATDGRICRTFTATGMAGLACHGAGQWRVAALAATKAESTGAYRMAASGLPDTIRDAAQQMIQGAPFDAAAERQARARDWK